MQVNQALQEYKHWKTRESVLEKELEVLKKEAREHQQFLDRLRRNPDFQDEVARKELGTVILKNGFIDSLKFQQTKSK